MKTLRFRTVVLLDCARLNKHGDTNLIDITKFNVLENRCMPRLLFFSMMFLTQRQTTGPFKQSVDHFRLYLPHNFDVYYISPWWIKVAKRVPRSFRYRLERAV